MLHDKIWFFSCFAPNQGQNEIQGFFFSPIETIENLPNDNINCWELQSGETNQIQSKRLGAIDREKYTPSMKHDLILVDNPSTLFRYNFLNDIFRWKGRLSSNWWFR